MLINGSTTGVRLSNRGKERNIEINYTSLIKRSNITAERFPTATIFIRSTETSIFCGNAQLSCASCCRSVARIGHIGKFHENNNPIFPITI